MSCRVRAGTTIGSGTCVVNCDVGKDVRIGDNCALYGVTLTAGSKVASNTLMYTLPVRKDARKGFVTIILNVDDVIKSRTSSTWCGIRVHDAIQRLGWSESRVWTDESHTTAAGDSSPSKKRPRLRVRRLCTSRSAFEVKTVRRQ